MGCAHNKNQDGFTLVEISIVMIIIGLLIGGIFGGMKLIENMQINKTVQDLKAIESSSLTFKDTYSRLPGDITTPSTRLSSCTVAPCATGGNGDRIIGNQNQHGSPITNADENYTFWHHLQASGLAQLDINNSLNMNFGEGSPSTGNIYGFRISDSNGAFTCALSMRTVAYLTNSADGNVGADVDCMFIRSLDAKIDDGLPNTGKMHGANFYFCAVSASSACDAQFATLGSGLILYDFKGF